MERPFRCPPACWSAALRWLPRWAMIVCKYARSPSACLARLKWLVFAAGCLLAGHVCRSRKRTCAA